ncbi:MAG: isochorismatase family cysteine hydrolase [Anaerolineae bacterium]
MPILNPSEPRGVEVSEHEMTGEAPGPSLADRARPFLSWLEQWFAHLHPLALDEVCREPDKVAIVSVDLINGFCYHGNLASPRVAALVPRVVELLQAAHAAGVFHFLMVQECHSEQAEEFHAYGPHGICGTSEAEMVPDFAALPFAGQFEIIHKNSIHAIVGTRLERWLEEHPQVDTFIVVGDCTDLCAYDAALDLKLRANIHDIPRRVIVPENCIQTYDLPVEHAQRIGALPHDGDLQHRLFLYQMALNKIEVVSSLV